MLPASLSGLTVTMVAPSRSGFALSTRTFIPHRCHTSIGVLGAASVAVAARLPGSVADGIAAFAPVLAG